MRLGHLAMVHLYVARHGQDEDNSNGILNGRRDRALTDLGRRQAREVGLKMKSAGFSLRGGECPAASRRDGASASASGQGVTFSRVFSSPLRRASDTAQIFCEILSGSSGGDATRSNGAAEMVKVKVETLDDLIERDFGTMTGQPTKSIVERCGVDGVLATETINYFLHPAGAETFPDLINRAKRLLVRIEEIAKDLPSSDAILLVTHGDFGKMLYAAYYNLQWQDVLRQFHFGNSEVLLLSRESGANDAHVFETMQYNS
mmetsp:Transcript_424/g.930  ORF Transcript_424/g.930 Transcript_424/m.930 type:complete len:260 (-) Transcript_424:129-908(-)